MQVKDDSFGHPTPMEGDFSALGDFGLEDGGQIVMEARDEEKDREDAAKLELRKAKHMAEQERRAELQRNLKRDEVSLAQAGAAKAAAH